MKMLNALKVLINLFFILLTLCFGIVICASLYLVFFGETEFIDLTIETSSLTEKITRIVFIIIVIGLQVISIFFLRKFIYDINANNLFTSRQTKWLGNTGKLIVASTILDMLFNFITEALFKQHIKISLIGEFNNLYYNSFYMLIIGLFFIFLSQVFHIAQELKEENDLTI